MKGGISRFGRVTYLCALYMKNLVPILLFMVFGCNEIEQCQLDPSLDYMVVGFYHVSDSSERDTLIFNGITASSATGNAYQIARDTIFTFALFYLDESATSMNYQFVTDSQSYSMSFRYDVSAFLYGEKCDPTFRFNNLTLESTSFDSIAVIGTVLDRNIPQNVEIYF